MKNRSFIQASFLVVQVACSLSSLIMHLFRDHHTVHAVHAFSIARRRVYKNDNMGRKNNSSYKDTGLYRTLYKMEPFKKAPALVFQNLKANMLSRKVPAYLSLCRRASAFLKGSILYNSLPLYKLYHFVTVQYLVRFAHLPFEMINLHSKFSLDLEKYGKWKEEGKEGS